MKPIIKPGIRRAFPLFALTLLSAGFASAQTLLLSDNFDTVGVGNTEPPFNGAAALAADQAGTLAPLTYSLASTGWDGYIQRGNGDQMLLAGYDFPEGGSASNGQVFASLNYNFAADANTLNSPLEIKFNLVVTDSADPENWGTIALGAFQNLFVNDNRNKFSSLFRDSGATQQFQGNGTTEPTAGTEIGSTMTFTDGDEITLLLSDTAGTGSAFAGNGSVAKIFINGNLQFTSPDLGLTASDGFISFQANGTKAYYDNLAITAITAVIADPFAVWMATNFPEIEAPDNAPTADPDQDGIPNLVEYVLQGGNPSDFNTAILPTLDASGENFIFTYLRRTAATGTTQIFQYGSNLSDWTDVPVNNGGLVAITSPEAGIEQVDITVAKGTETKLFGRLQVHQP